MIVPMEPAQRDKIPCGVAPGIALRRHETLIALHRHGAPRV